MKSLNLPILMWFTLFSAAQAAESRWSITETKSPLTDKMDITATLPSSDRNGLLAFQCKNGEIAAAILTSKHLGSYGSKEVIYRVENDKPISEAWNLHNHGQIIIAQPSATASFINRIAGRHNLFLRTEDSSGQTIDLTFDMSNATEIAERVFATCNLQRSLSRGK